MRRALVLAGLAACRFGFDERFAGDAGDARGADVTDAADATDAPGDAAVATACGTVSLLADDFAAAAAGPQWYPYQNAGGTTTQTGGELVVALQASQPVGYSGYDSSWKYDLRGGRVYVEVTQTTSTATNAQTDIQMIAVNGDTFTIFEEAGILTAAQVVGSVETNLATVPYNATQQRWWQFREAGGTLYLETSADGVTFAPLATAPTPSWAATVDIALEAGAYQTETNPGSAHFAHLDGGTASGSWCKAGTQRDDFNSGVIGDRWGASYSLGGCTYSESGGAVDFTLARNVLQDCGLVSGAGFDLTGDAVFTELVTPPAADPNIYTFLRASTQAGDNVEVALIGSAIVSAQNINGTYSMLSGAPYNATADKLWQLSESGGTLFWQVSSDGTTWTTLHSQASPIPLSAVNLAIGVGTAAGVSTPGDAVFSTFGQLPP